MKEALWLLPVLGLLAACAGFFIRLSRQRVYLLIGVSLFCMIGPPAIASGSLISLLSRVVRALSFELACAVHFTMALCKI
jgi:hypothetical protein